VRPQIPAILGKVSLITIVWRASEDFGPGARTSLSGLKHAAEGSGKTPVEAKLVAEVEFDHFTGGRFRHGTKFVRWRPEKAPRDCTMEQVKRENKSALGLL
jgi:ATP-dependent DNA ligase